MLAYRFLNWDIPYPEVVFPVSVGVMVAALCLFAARVLAAKRARELLTVPPQAKPQADISGYDPFVLGSPTEQRRSFRRGGNPVEVNVIFQGGYDRPLRGWVIDRSVGGLGLVVPREFPQGTLIQVLPVNAPNVTPWVDVEVRSCRAVKEGFEIGCQFVKTPQWAVLLLFG